jgi:hypothetical protein
MRISAFVGDDVNWGRLCCASSTRLRSTAHIILQREFVEGPNEKSDEHTESGKRAKIPEKAHELLGKQSAFAPCGPMRVLQTTMAPFDIPYRTSFQELPKESQYFRYTRAAFGVKGNLPRIFVRSHRFLRAMAGLLQPPAFRRRNEWTTVA